MINPQALLLMYTFKKESIWHRRFKTETIYEIIFIHQQKQTTLQISLRNFSLYSTVNDSGIIGIITEESAERIMQRNHWNTNNRAHTRSRLSTHTMQKQVPRGKRQSSTPYLVYLLMSPWKLLCLTFKHVHSLPSGSGWLIRSHQHTHKWTVRSHHHCAENSPLVFGSSWSSSRPSGVASIFYFH